jgi:aspartate-semialdehyde dehydrogenase
MRVAVVGATGAVGSTMLGVMRERTFPADEVVAFASQRSVGRRIDFGDAELEVRALSDESIRGFDLALFSAGASPTPARSSSTTRRAGGCRRTCRWWSRRSTRTIWRGTAG